MLMNNLFKNANVNPNVNPNTNDNANHNANANHNVNANHNTNAKRKADTKKKGDKPAYTAPADAAEAKARILTAIASKSVTTEEADDKVRFYGNTRTMRSEFRMLGGEWVSRPDENIYRWEVPAAYWADPSLAVPTMSAARASTQSLPADSLMSLKNKIRQTLSEVLAPAMVDSMMAKILSGIDEGKSDSKDDGKDLPF